MYETVPTDDREMLFGTFGYSAPEHTDSGAPPICHFIKGSVNSLNVSHSSNCPCMQPFPSLALFSFAHMHARMATNLTEKLVALDTSVSRSGRMTQKCDIYSFGVVLLELLSGKQPVNNSSTSPDANLLVHEFADLLDQWKLEELKVLWSSMCCTHFVICNTEKHQMKGKSLLVHQNFLRESACASTFLVSQASTCALPLGSIPFALYKL